MKSVNMNQREILFISINGLYSSGSSALVDFLRGYQDLEVIDCEFQIFRKEFVELLYKINEGSGFLKKDFLSVRKEMLHYGYRPNISSQLYKLTRILPIKFNYIKFNNRRGYNDFFPEYEAATIELFDNLQKFNQEALEGQKIPSQKLEKVFRPYFKRVVGYIHTENRIPVIDQLIKSPMPLIPKILPYSKIIFVVRDPRDHFCDIIKRLDCKPEFKSLDRAKVFVNEYKYRYDFIDKFIKTSPENVIKIKFEDLIYKEEIVKKYLEEFLKLKGEYLKEFSRFDSDESISNTQMFNIHKEKGEIDLIEKSLSKWFYSFPNV